MTGLRQFAFTTSRLRVSFNFDALIEPTDDYPIASGKKVRASFSASPIPIGESLHTRVGLSPHGSDRAIRAQTFKVQGSDVLCYYLT